MEHLDFSSTFGSQSPVFLGSVSLLIVQVSISIAKKHATPGVDTTILLVPSSHHMMWGFTDWLLHFYAFE